jgi:hypothetical protein
MPRPLALGLLALLLANVTLLLLTVLSAEQVARAQLQQAMASVDRSSDKAQGVAAPPVVDIRPKPAAKSVCRVFGPHERALAAAKLLNRLQQAGADVELFTSAELAANGLLDAAILLVPDRFWVKARQNGRLHGAKPEELERALNCD